MSLNFPTEEIISYKESVSIGIKAMEIKESPQWQWVKTNILGALFDRAVIVLRNAKTDEERMKAQQMFLASHEPEEILMRLINEGQAAQLALQEISNPTKEGELNG